MRVRSVRASRRASRSSKVRPGASSGPSSISLQPALRQARRVDARNPGTRSMWCGPAWAQQCSTNGQRRGRRQCDPVAVAGSRGELRLAAAAARRRGRRARSSRQRSVTSTAARSVLGAFRRPLRSTCSTVARCARMPRSAATRLARARRRTWWSRTLVPVARTISSHASSAWRRASKVALTRSRSVPDPSGGRGASGVSNAGSMYSTFASAPWRLSMDIGGVAAATGSPPSTFGSSKRRSARCVPR